MSDIAIRVENLSKSYQITHSGRGKYKTLQEDVIGFLRRPFGRGEDSSRKETFWALKDVSFEVKHGEVLGIIGRNGAGKSTLLKILSRITKPTSGHAEIYGRVGSLLEVGTGFHPELTGRENIFLNGAVLGMSRRDIMKHFDEIVAFADVEQFLDTPAKRYSSGMYMRLAFAVAAHLEPEVLVVDEVLAVGDAEFQKKCLGKMSEVAKSGRTVLFVSHNMGALINICTRGVLLDAGQLCLDSDISSVVYSYLNDQLPLEGEINLEQVVRSIKGTGDLRFTRIRLLNRDFEPTGYIDVADGVVVEIHYRVSTPVVGAQVAFRLWNQDGICILSSTDLDSDVNIPPYKLSTGEYVAKCHIPGEYLRLGRYSLDLGSSIPNFKLFDELRQCIAFEVIGSSAVEVKLAQTRLGVIAPIFEWTTKRNEQSTISRIT